MPILNQSNAESIAAVDLVFIIITIFKLLDFSLDMDKRKQFFILQI